MKNTKTFTTHQIGALITMIALAVWGIWVSWLHITRSGHRTYEAHHDRRRSHDAVTQETGD